LICGIQLGVSDQPATKQDLADAVQQVTDKLTEAIRDSQTELLRGFYEWARPVDVRFAMRMSWCNEWAGWKIGFRSSNAGSYLRLIDP
jgi:hypothetical protein